MAQPSQFSTEEENFYKDIQDLVKNGSRSGKELSSFLQCYMNLLSRADLDNEDDTFIINFTKAGLIIEASAKVYGSKVDKLWLSLEHIMESLRSRSLQPRRKQAGGEDVEEIVLDGSCDYEASKRKMPQSRRRKKFGNTCLSVDDFLEIDNISGLLGKSMNESDCRGGRKFKLADKVPNLFIKAETKRKRMDVCLNKNTDEKDLVRLRDWVVTENGLLVKEVYTLQPDKRVTTGDPGARDGSRNEEAVDCQLSRWLERVNLEATVEGTTAMEEPAIPGEGVGDEYSELRMRNSVKEKVMVERVFAANEEDVLSELNISKESDVAKFPNVLDRRRSIDRLVDIEHVAWTVPVFEDEIITSKTMKNGKTNKTPCQLCRVKKVHKKRAKRCTTGKKAKSLDTYLTPFVQPAVPEPQFGILPDEDLHSVFKIEMKLIEQLGKANGNRNINEAYNPEESPEELQNFLGFDEFENRLTGNTTTEIHEEEMLEVDLRDDPGEENNENIVEEVAANNEFELPLPVTEPSVPEVSVGTSVILDVGDPGPRDDETMANSELEYQKLVFEELKDHYAARTSFERNKELGMRISKWHNMISGKVKLSQERGALNMNALAAKILGTFEPSLDGGLPTLPFKELVKNQTERDIPRYFFACLQMANEENLELSKSNPQPLATDCIIVKQLKTTRMNYTLDESTLRSPAKNRYSSSVQASKKRNSSVCSPTTLDGKKLSKKAKQNIVKSHKRPKNFASVSSKRIRRSYLDD